MPLPAGVDSPVDDAPDEVGGEPPVGVPGDDEGERWAELGLGELT